MAGEAPAARRPTPVRRVRGSPRSGPEVVAPTNKVNVALPFSTFRVDEASAELVELTGIVVELARLLEDMAGPDAHQLHERAEALAARLR